MQWNDFSLPMKTSNWNTQVLVSSQWPMLVLIPTGHNFSSALPKPIGWIQSTSFSGMFLKVIYRYNHKIRNCAENGILINIFRHGSGPIDGKRWLWEWNNKAFNCYQRLWRAWIDFFLSLNSFSGLPFSFLIYLSTLLKQNYLRKIPFFK